MKKLIHTSLITLALASATCNASQSTEAGAISQNKLSYACNVMLARGSKMFCGNEEITGSYAKAAISEMAYIDKSSYACNTMAERGSEMFCQKEKAEVFSHANNR